MMTDLLFITTKISFMKTLRNKRVHKPANVLENDFDENHDTENVVIQEDFGLEETERGKDKKGSL
jgi:hypothetical protein